MVQVYNIPYSRTANNIIEYLFGYILAKERNYNLFASKIDGFSKLKSIGTRRSKKNNPIQTGNSQQYTDYNRLLLHDGAIVVNGYMQKFDYYKNHIEEIKPLIIPDEKSDITPGDNDLVMHVRLTDYVTNGNNVPFNVYDDFIKSNIDLFDNFYIVSDDPKSDFVKKLESNNKVKVIHQDMYKDFDLLRMSKNTFISQSSYSWLATYFGESKNIYAPLYNGNNVYLWKTNPLINDIDLVDKNDERFKIITF